MFSSIADVKQEITTAIESTGVAKATEYDLDAIVEAVYEVNNGTWYQVGDEEDFWKAVEAAAK